MLFCLCSSHWKESRKCSLSPSHLSTPKKFARNRKTKFGNRKNQIKVTAESERAGKQHWAVGNYRREQKQSRKVQFLSLCVFWHRTKKFYNKKASLSKVHLKVFRKAQQQNSPDLTVSVRFPPFSILLKQKKNYAVVVCGSRRMFTIIWNTLRWSINVTMPTAHIFAIFHHNFFCCCFCFYVFGDTFFAVYKVFSLSVDETWKTPFNNFFALQNWKIVFKECQKHFLERFSSASKNLQREL